MAKKRATGPRSRAAAADAANGEADEQLDLSTISTSSNDATNDPDVVRVNRYALTDVKVSVRASRSAAEA